MVKPAIVRHAFMHHVLALMPKRSVSKIMRQRQTLRQILIQPQRTRQRACNLGDLNSVRQACAEVIALMVHKDLRLVLEATESCTMNNTITIALKRRACRAFRFWKKSATADFRINSILRPWLSTVS